MWNGIRNIHLALLLIRLTKGIGKVEQAVKVLCWEFIQTTIQAVLTVITLFFLSWPTALLGGIAFSIFAWLTKKANKERSPLREKRYDLYEVDGHKRVEGVQSVETVIMFGQTNRLLAQQRELQGEIYDLGTREDRITIYKYHQLRILILRLLKRIILGIWVFQLLNGTMDLASLIFVNELTERLFHSFW